MAEVLHTEKGTEYVRFEDNRESLYVWQSVFGRNWLWWQAHRGLNLTASQVRELVAHLQAWLDTGSLTPPPASTQE